MAGGADQALPAGVGRGRSPVGCDGPAAFIPCRAATIPGVGKKRAGDQDTNQRGEQRNQRSAANCDNVFTLPTRVLTRRRGALGAGKLTEFDRALTIALGLD